MAGSPFRPTGLLASARGAVRGVLEAGLWLWLGRSGAAEAIGAVAVVLLDRLPELLVAAAQGLGWRV
jgi:hypothetical protein